MLSSNSHSNPSRLARLPRWAVALLLATAAAIAQEDGWVGLNREVMELYRAGDINRAVVVAKKALEVAEETGGPDHPNVAASTLMWPRAWVISPRFI